MSASPFYHPSMAAAIEALQQSVAGQAEAIAALRRSLTVPIEAINAFNKSMQVVSLDTEAVEAFRRSMILPSESLAALNKAARQAMLADTEALLGFRRAIGEAAIASFSPDVIGAVRDLAQRSPDLVSAARTAAANTPSFSEEAATVLEFLNDHPDARSDLTAAAVSEGEAGVEFPEAIQEALDSLTRKVNEVADRQEELGASSLKLTAAGVVISIIAILLACIMFAAMYGVILPAPDTSPNHQPVPGDHESRDTHSPPDPPD